MISPDLLKILVCPETKQPLKELPAEQVELINRKIKSAELKNRSGAVVDYQITSALAREDGQFAYLVREGIPIMLTDEAIPLR